GGRQRAERRSIFGGDQVAVARHRRVVYRRNGDRDRGDVRIGPTVIGFEGETRLAAEVRGRSKAVGAGRWIGDGHDPLIRARPGHKAESDRVAIDVGRGQRARGGSVFRRGQRVVACYRRVIHGRDRDRDRGHV